MSYSFYISMLNFFILEIHRQWDIPLTGDLKFVYKILGRSPFKVHY